MPGTATTWLETVVPSTVVSAPGNTGALQAPYGACDMAVVANVTAYTSGTVTFEVQWSNDGVNFFSADQGTNGVIASTAIKDTFNNLAAVGTLYKLVPVRAPFYRITWTTGSYTMNVQAGPAAPFATGVGIPEGFIEGASSQVGSVSSAGGAPVVNAIGSTTLVATYVQATASTMSAITAVPTIPSQAGPVPVRKLGLLVICTANTWVGGVLEVLWSTTGVAGSTWHGDPTDTFAGSSAAFTSFKLLDVKAPYYALAFTTQTTVGSATFTANACVCQL